MSITIVCDGCGDDSGDLQDSMWRTFCASLEYLPGTRDFGSSDTLLELILCPRCVDEIVFERVEQYLRKAVASPTMTPHINSENCWCRDKPDNEDNPWCEVNYGDGPNSVDPADRQEMENSRCPECRFPEGQHSLKCESGRLG